MYTQFSNSIQYFKTPQVSLHPSHKPFFAGPKTDVYKGINPRKVPFIKTILSKVPNLKKAHQDGHTLHFDERNVSASKLDEVYENGNLKKPKQLAARNTKSLEDLAGLFKNMTVKEKAPVDHTATQQALIERYDTIKQESQQAKATQNAAANSFLSNAQRVLLKAPDEKPLNQVFRRKGFVGTQIDYGIQEGLVTDTRPQARHGMNLFRKESIEQIRQQVPTETNLLEAERKREIQSTEEALQRILQVTNTSKVGFVNELRPKN